MSNFIPSGETESKEHLNPIVIKVMRAKNRHIKAKTKSNIREDDQEQLQSSKHGIHKKDICPAAIVTKMIDWNIGPQESINKKSS